MYINLTRNHSFLQEDRREQLATLVVQKPREQSPIQAYVVADKAFQLLAMWLDVFFGEWKYTQVRGNLSGLIETKKSYPALASFPDLNTKPAFT